MNDPDVDLIVDLSVLECYLLNSEILGEERTNELLECIGTLRADYRTHGIDNKYFLIGHRTPLENLEREAQLTRIKIFVADAPYQVLRDSRLRVEDDTFLESLFNHIRNDVISHQAHIAK